ncbi:MAG: hypothetical protein PHU88_02940 [candidate division Zixibacteria bacterium]|nr:hypothetical protein [candidate division Zixibacteria bacterium]MDD5425795.1 hypothetical protein [candidate division Zixibacteria bacterium]
MKKTILITFLMLILMSLGSFATDTRVLTMGENGMILKDDANIWLFPSQINYYPNILTAEICYVDEYIYYPKSNGYDYAQDAVTRLGINWKFGGDNPWVLGTYFHNNAENYDFMLDQANILPSTTIMPWHGPYWYDYDMSYSNKRFDLFWGKMLGENAFGVHFGMIHSSYKHETPNDRGERGFGKYDFHVGTTMMEGKLDLAAGIELFSYTYKNTYLSPDTGNYEYYKPQGNSTIFVRGRYFHEYSPVYTFVPHAEFRIGKYEYDQNDWVAADTTAELDYSRKYNATLFDLGIGMHYTPATKVLAVIDVGFMYMNLKEEYTEVVDEDSTETDEEKWSYTMLPYFKIGLEAEVFSWMDLRLGATSYWTKYTNEETDFDEETEKYYEKYPYNQTYLGLGLNFNRLHIDCYVDPELFMDGFYFISGTDSKYMGMNFQISAKYDMF